MKITERCTAKINLSLDVVSKRPDGYHNLLMIMQGLELSDTLTVEQTQTGEIEILCNLPYIPTDETNHAHKAAVAFFEHTGMQNPGLLINIEKNIPSAAGMAGGSSNAAGVLRGLNRMFNTGLKGQTLMEIGLKVGADVPYCICGGTKLASLLGQELEPLPSMPDCHVLICKPEFGISTPKVFANLKLDQIKDRPDTKLLVNALETGDLNRLAKNMKNVLEQGIYIGGAQIAGIKSAMLDLGALGAMMTGSGSAVFGIFDNESSAKSAYNQLKNKYNQTFLTRPEKGEYI